MVPENEQHILTVLHVPVMFSLFILVCVKVLNNFCFDLSALNSEI